MLLQSGLDEKWWADSMACCCLSAKKMSKTFWQMGFRLVQWLNIILFLRRASQGSTTLGKNVLPGIYATVHGENMARRYLWLQTLRRWENMDASEIRPSKKQRERSIGNTKRKTNSSSQ